MVGGVDTAGDEDDFAGLVGDGVWVEGWHFDGLFGSSWSFRNAGLMKTLFISFMVNMQGSVE